jgi:hypothetical protein
MRTKLALLYICLLLPLAGCTGDGLSAPPPPDEAILGTYNLSTINALELPFLLMDDMTRRVEVVAGSITLNSDATFRDAINYQVTPYGGEAGPWDDIVVGSFTQNLDYLTFLTEQGGVYPVSLGVDGTLMQMIGEYQLIYSR